MERSAGPFGRRSTSAMLADAQLRIDGKTKTGWRIVEPRSRPATWPAHLTTEAGLPKAADATCCDEPAVAGSERPTAILVEGSLLLREGLLGILQPAAFRVAAAVRSPEAALAALEGPLAGQVIDLLLCSLEPRQDVPMLLEAVAALQRRGTITRTVLLLPVACSPADLVLAVQGGVDGVILKDISGERLLRALDLVLHGQDVLPLGAAAQILASRPADAAPEGTVAAPARASPAPAAPARTLNLSDRERQILRCLVEGYANKLIARRLAIAEATVKVHIKGLLRKINVSNRTQAAIWALNHGAAGPGDTPTPPGEATEDEPGPSPRFPPLKRPGAPLLRAVS